MKTPKKTEKTAAKKSEASGAKKSNIKPTTPKTKSRFDDDDDDFDMPLDDDLSGFDDFNRFDDDDDY